MGQYADVADDRLNFASSVDPLSSASSWDPGEMGVAASQDVRQAA
jgi:hypothetical protein